MSISVVNVDGLGLFWTMNHVTVVEPAAPLHS